MTALLLFCALEGSALDEAEARIDDEKFTEALQALEGADEADARYRPLRDHAVNGVARNLQRASGYRAALNWLEPRLESRTIVEHYVETCIWAGEEQRGIERLAALPGPLRKESFRAEMQLHWVRHDYATIEQRAREEGRPAWRDWAREQRELRERFTYRAQRGWWVALFAALAIGAACFVLHRFAGAGARVGNSPQRHRGTELRPDRD